MSFDVQTTLETVETALNAMSPQRFSAVRIGSAPQALIPEGFTAIIGMDSVQIAELTLTHPTEVHTVRIRIYRAQAAGPDRDVELMKARIIPEVMDLFKADFTLGATVRAIDWGGIYGATPRVDYDEEEIGEKPYWTAHLILPLIVDPTTAFVA